MTDHPTPPAWVRKRDGTVVPFDGDKIGQALFAATQTLGRPDAFLARELTDSIVHFLSAESDSDTVTTAQIAEIVGKTVRELGQPALAEAFANQPRRPKTSEEIVLHAPRDRPPRVFLPDLLRDYTGQAVFTSQVLALQKDGLLSLAGLDAPGELEASLIGVFDLTGEAGIAAYLHEVRRSVAGFVVFDSPEFVLARGHAQDIPLFVRDTLLAARLLNLRVIINLNLAEPPSWADDRGRGPLFEKAAEIPEHDLSETAADLLERFTPASAANVRIHWHLSERDFLGDAARLRRVAHGAATGAPVTFVIDRPRRPLWLAPGIDRQHPAVLLTVSLHLSQLAGLPFLKDNAELFLQKLGSLTRLALSAGVQKREYLRRLERVQASALTTGFLLDRARLVVVPHGLDGVVQQFAGVQDFGKQLMTRLRDVLKVDGRTSHLDACVEGPPEVVADVESTAEGIAEFLTRAWESRSATRRFTFRARNEPTRENR